MAAEPESITDDLRDDILAGLFPPGDRLVELRLSERYDCGRAAVRAALIELGTEGLVDREANRGATVRSISISEAIQITQARAALESLIAAQAAKYATASQRAELTEIGSAMREAVATGDNDAYSELNSLLHATVRKVSKHTVAAYLVKHLRNRAARHQFRLAQIPGRPAISLAQHIEIIDAINAGNSERAATAMEAHLQSVIDALTTWNDS